MGVHTDKSIVVTMCVKQPNFTVCTCICVALEDTGDNEETVETPTSKYSLTQYVCIVIHMIRVL